MRIGINTRFLLPHKMEGFGWFTFEVVKRIVQNHPEHEFVFFFDRQYDEKFVFAKNVKPVVLFPPTRLVVLIVSWFEFSLPSALKREKIDLFFSPDGFLSLRSKCPQIGVIHDLNFLHNPQDLPLRFRLYYNYFFPKFARKARKLITVSNYSKQDIVKSYNISEKKITVAWNGVSDVFQPLSEVDIQEVRNQYTQGKPYFLFVGALHPRKNLKSLLQAFQLYRIQGNKGKLLIVGENLFTKNYQHAKLVSEEFQNDVHFTGHLSQTELVKVTASALSLVFIPYFEGFGIPLVEAMKSGIPVISGNLTSLPEVVEDAAILVNPFDINEIVDAMKKINEDKDLRQALISKGIERAKIFNWDATAEKVWDVISKEL